MGLLRELADRTGLSALVTAALAAAVADGADCIDGVGQLCGDREHVFGAKASTMTMWRLVDERIDAAPPTGAPLYIDIDATLVIDQHSRGWPDVEEVLRPPPVAGVPGPPGDRRRGNVGRAAAGDHYRVLHIAARITGGARQLHLRIDATWRWATATATAWQRIRAALPSQRQTHPKPKTTTAQRSPTIAGSGRGSLPRSSNWQLPMWRM
ncbi:hypothetical protein MSAR_11460 [Mycolicibacterium sarraceniae]|uniref:Uncharacterized protein n=1 Tax=Mycolicibacterium sarraceniae TaxID=1534348 RepID=A0A7I7SN77_9MYCO|nr:hypothetical protein MSAR_11460 [Mycolicibacterium sarraceniae]